MNSRNQAFATRLLAWWETRGRHDLPWQHPRTPYRVWVSEVMLQQTQVTTVLPYFERWLERFPDLDSLASAPLDDVLGHWAGLGYYARARNLHKAAQQLMAHHDGVFPKEPADWEALPGIGESTANAIVSQSQDRPLPILDGNVKRVLARHAAIDGWPGKTAVLNTLWDEAKKRVPSHRGADYTQAIMDLGATLCTRSKPDCLNCPVSADCQGRASDEIERYPGRKPRQTIPEESLHWLLVQRDGAVLLERRPERGIWGGLWCPPQSDELASLCRRFGMTPEDTESLFTFDHRLTHRRYQIQGWTADAHSAGLALNCSPDRNWFEPKQWKSLGLPKPVARALAQLETDSP